MPVRWLGQFDITVNAVMKTAVILFNLGGPDSLQSVQPFLFNLFNDAAIITLPQPFRWLIATLISKRRVKEATHIYEKIGGASPLLANTRAQSEALEKELGAGFKCFISMRYWHPMAADTARKVAEYNPDKIIFLPLYPQYSGTTTASSFTDFYQALAPYKLAAPIHEIHSYPTLDGFLAPQVEAIRLLYATAQKQTGRAPRILFSAHGLPQKTIDAGDPYQMECEETAAALVARLAIPNLAIPNLDWKNTYQSRVGPLAWIKPYTDAEIEAAGATQTPLVLVPIAFVSEHSETLYELDQQYRDLAAGCGVPFFARTPTVGIQPAFIRGLADLVRATNAA